MIQILDLELRDLNFNCGFCKFVYLCALITPHSLSPAEGWQGKKCCFSFKNTGIGLKLSEGSSTLKTCDDCISLHSGPFRP